MRVLTNLLASSLIALWLVAIAVISIQNVTPISLRFFTWQSVSLPFGVALAFCVSVGLGLGALLPLLRVGPLRPAARSRRSSGAGEPLENWD